MALSEGEISNISLQNSVDLHPSDLGKLLRKMRDDGKLIASGFGRGTIYRLNRNYVANSGVSSSDVASSEVSSSDVASSGVSSSEVSSSEVSSSEVSSSGVSSSEVSSSGVSSSDVASSDEENVNTMIKDVCRHQWMSSKDVSLRIGRNPIYVRRVIKKLVVKGEIKQEYPNQPTHPSQRYRTVSDR